MERAWLALNAVIAAFVGYCTFRHLYQPFCLRCQMTFMSPHYSRVAEQRDMAVPPYALFRYEEGGGAGGRPGEWEACTPVLFIPGNRGSYGQARSLGSRLAQLGSRSQGQCLTLYTVDLLDELSALSGAVLTRQAAWVEECIKTIASLHRQPPALVLVGHSMGGILARLAAASPTAKMSPSTLIVTMATPNAEPALRIDPALEAIYANLNAAPPSSRARLLAITGGPSDIQVLEAPSGPDHVRTEDIRFAWSSPDHRAIVWETGVINALADSIASFVSTKSLAPLLGR